MPEILAGNLKVGHRIIERSSTGGIILQATVGEIRSCVDRGNLHAMVHPGGSNGTRSFCYDRNTTVEIAGSTAAAMARMADHAAA